MSLTAGLISDNSDFHNFNNLTFTGIWIHLLNN